MKQVTREALLMILKEFLKEYSIPLKAFDKFAKGKGIQLPNSFLEEPQETANGDGNSRPNKKIAIVQY